MAQIISIDNKTWRIEDDGVRFFVLLGKEKALMIDSGMNTPNALDLVRSIKEIPSDFSIELLNTHADPDHISGNDCFDKYYMSPNEKDNLKAHGKNGMIIPVKSGDIIDLGERPLEIIDNPGHTPGSIAVLDILDRTLYSGDAVQNSRIFMFGERRDINLYVQSLVSLKSYSSRFDKIFPSHGDIPIAPGMIDKLIEGATEIAAQKASGKAVNVFGNQVTLYQFDYAGFLCE